jgi:adenylate cyclase, class 2
MARRNEEVEIKFHITDSKQITAMLRRNGFRLKTKRTHEMNVLYDFADGSLRAQGEVLRVRSYGNRWTLTHKAKAEDGRHKRRVETETEVVDGEALSRVFAALGLRESFRYEKFRSEWTDGKGDVVIDETPIGNVGEIEGPARWIDATAKKLGITRAQYSTASYAQLFFSWKQATGSDATEMTFAAVRKSKQQ